MPTYEYVCMACANAWEEMQKITAPPLEVCPKCQQPSAKRQVSGGNFILKGGGWYSDLYSSPKPSSGSGGGESTSSAAPKDGGSAAASAPAKTESTAPAAAPAAGSGTPKT